MNGFFLLRFLCTEHRRGTRDNPELTLIRSNFKNIISIECGNQKAKRTKHPDPIQLFTFSYSSSLSVPLPGMSAILVYYEDKRCLKRVLLLPRDFSDTDEQEGNK
jgi:hypothetical protein